MKYLEVLYRGSICDHRDMLAGYVWWSSGMEVCERVLGRVGAMMTRGCGSVTRESWTRTIAIFSCKICVGAIVIRSSPVFPTHLCCIVAVGPSSDVQP